MSIDKLLEPKNVGSIKDWLWETMKQAGVEASEEMFTEVANILSDAAIMGQRSDWAQMVQQYKSKGMSETEAKKRAFLDCVGQVMWASAGGALSGGIMGGAVSAFNYNSAAKEVGTTHELPGGQKETASTGEVVYTAQRDAAGNVYVQIDADILKGKPRDQWGKTVQNTIKNIFGSGLKLARGTIFTNRKGRGEYTNGSYTKMLERTDPGMYQDKMRMAVGSDGILKSASDVVYEDTSHERTDDIVGFNRGKIVVSVKDAGYTGDVLTAIYSDGKETFFDINNLVRKTIEATTPERYRRIRRFHTD